MWATYNLINLQTATFYFTNIASYYYYFLRILALVHLKARRSCRIVLRFLGLHLSVVGTVDVRVRSIVSNWFLLKNKQTKNITTYNEATHEQV